MLDKRHLKEVTSTVQNVTGVHHTISGRIPCPPFSAHPTAQPEPQILLQPSFWINLILHLLSFSSAFSYLPFFTSSIPYAVKKKHKSPILRRLVLNLQIYYWIWSLNPTSLIFPLSRFTSLLSLLLDESSKNAIFIILLPWFKTTLVPYHLLDKA